MKLLKAKHIDKKRVNIYESYYNINFQNLFLENCAYYFCNLKVMEVLHKMATNNNKRSAVPEAKSALDDYKYKVANQIGVNLKPGYNGDLTSKEAGSVGGTMVKNMIQQAEHNLANNKQSF